MFYNNYRVRNIPKHKRLGIYFDVVGRLSIASVCDAADEFLCDDRNNVIKVLDFDKVKRIYDIKK